MPLVLISVSDKTGLIEFASSIEELGWSLIASGGTASALTEAGITVTPLTDYTGSPEILGGRVKTLHPRIHAGILARNNEKDSADLERVGAVIVDMVVVNLYPFRETIKSDDATLADAIENIDIGGVALIRAAAKNYERVTTLTSPEDYHIVCNELKSEGTTSFSTRTKLALKAFRYTASYDTAIANYLSQRDSEETILPFQDALPATELRYGENPHQAATLYNFSGSDRPLGGELLQGKALSYNNLLDLDAAWRVVNSFTRSTVSIVKHLSPCGIASADTQPAAFKLALQSDPVSAYGGIIAANQKFEAETAKSLGKLFVECIIAPGFSDEALSILARRKNCRLINMPGMGISPSYELRSINQGILWQERDTGDPGEPDHWKIASNRPPSAQEQEDLRFAWKSCQHVKSNAIVLVKDNATIGIGGGQPNRVDCVKIAIDRAGDKAKGSVLASDAFFPFGDSIELAAQAGITAVVQPGGSIRDEESIEAANRHDIAMFFTGTRHFRH